MQLNYLSSKIIQAAISVHKELGPGLLEIVYQVCMVMVIELKSMELKVQSEVSLPKFTIVGSEYMKKGFGSIYWLKT